MGGSAVRKIDLMHRVFGRNEDHKCGECKNLLRIAYRSAEYKKCVVYGDTNSAASDWALKYTACGMFNEDYSGNPIIRMVCSRGAPKPEESPLDGQICLEE